MKNTNETTPNSAIGNAQQNVQEVQDFLDDLFELRANSPSVAELKSAADFEKNFCEFSFDQEEL
ncbi:MAG: hypothetical protein KDD55_11520 [Bdellovibrionales bacterium]|nr:hypothetical protein [Bdellovibrionales bacterium]